MMVETEQTPNPDTLKFLPGKKVSEIGPVEFLKNDRLWCHAKNSDALYKMIENSVHCFWHDKDDYTLTSQNVIWTFSEKRTTRNSIIVCQDEEQTKLYKSMPIDGICTDYVY